MSIREQVQRHRKDTRWIVTGLFVLLAALAGMYYLIQRSRDLPSELVTNRVLLFVLWYINLTLILAVLFVLLRNLFKLVVERHHRILGSKFKTKLVATYVGLSLIPVLLLFAYGSRMMRGWIDRWFEEPSVSQLFDEGKTVAESLHTQIEETTLRDSHQVLSQIDDFDLANTNRRPQLHKRLQDLLDQLQLDALAVYDHTNFVHAVVDPKSGLVDLPEPGNRIIQDAMDKGETTRRVEVEGRGLLFLAVTAAQDLEPDVSRPIVVAGSLLGLEVSTKSASLINENNKFEQLQLGKSNIEAGYVLNFLMVTLLILLASSWVGLYLARRITVPVQALAEATQRISDGDLDFQVEVDADDELGVLVHSFNSMTAELQRNKELLEESNLELIASNQRLAEERAIIGAVLQNLAAGVVSVDEDGLILTCNGAALKMLDQKEKAVVGRPVQDVWGDAERQKLAELFTREPGDSGRVTKSVRLLLGNDWRTFEAKVSTMRDRQGHVSGRVMVLEELTELVRAQQLAAWSEAAKRIAHEIKNPLTPIRLSAERLLKKHQQNEPDLGPALEEGVEIITREVEAMKGMVDEFSRFARMPQPRPTEVQLNSLVDETLNLYQGLKQGVEVAADIPSGVESAWLDGEQIKRALINLLDNALEATDAPGLVAVSAAKSNGNLVLRIADTGKGIPTEAKDKLFLPHFSTKRRGTGLGLSIVHRIVSDHHGTIRAEDNSPQGTVFTITLPQK